MSSSSDGAKGIFDGFEAEATASLTQTGLLLAHALQRLRQGDLAIILAYSRVYPELGARPDRRRDRAFVAE